MGVPLKNENVALIERLQNQARKVLDALIPDNAHIILLDYPHYPNVGDSLIWLGEIAYLKSRGLKASYVSDCHNFDLFAVKKIINKNSFILINGGGNFGDLWSHLHNFKLQVLRDFPQTPIIQLPQTIHFKDEKNIAETAEVIKQHGNFTLLVRSQESLAIAQKNFSTTSILCPDMAFFIGPIKVNNSPLVDYFILSRTDTEKSSNGNVRMVPRKEFATSRTEDWLENSGKEFKLQRIESHHLFRKFFKLINPTNQVLLFMWNLLAQARLARGVALLSSGKLVITDRLHAHILCILINKPHIVIDNNYGKIGDIYRAWTSTYPLSLFVNDLSDMDDLKLKVNLFESKVEKNTALTNTQPAS